jgi:hypothetical protein
LAGLEPSHRDANKHLIWKVRGVFFNCHDNLLCKKPYFNKPFLNDYSRRFGPKSRFVAKTRITITDFADADEKISGYRFHEKKFKTNAEHVFFLQKMYGNRLKRNKKWQKPKFKKKRLKKKTFENIS